jgi:hypothetical protein
MDSDSESDDGEVSRMQCGDSQVRGFMADGSESVHSLGDYEESVEQLDGRKEEPYDQVTFLFIKKTPYYFFSWIANKMLLFFCIFFNSN